MTLNKILINDIFGRDYLLKTYPNLLNIFKNL